jgi:catechol 2,3-dioxygenase-like lactoylglutathione lyase family enzyme
MVAAFAGVAPFQVAFVVRDLERAVQDFDRVLGAGPWRGYVFDQTTVEGREYHGRPGDWSVRLVLNDSRPQYELIEPLAGANIYTDWLDVHGEGFHHVAYVVESVDGATKQMTAAGYPAIQRGHSFGADRDGAFAYFDTAGLLGFITEAVEPPGRLPEPAFRLP